MQKRAHRLSKPEMPPNKTNTEPILLKRGTIRDFEAGNQKDLEPYAQHSHLNLLTGKKTASMEGPDHKRGLVTRGFELS